MTAFQFTVIALAAYRVWQFIGEDLLMKQIRLKLGRRGVEFVTCPWCLGFWVCVAWVLAFWADARAIWVAVPFALSSVVGFAYALVTRLDEYERDLPG